MNLRHLWHRFAFRPTPRWSLRLENALILILDKREGFSTALPTNSLSHSTLPMLQFDAFSVFDLWVMGSLGNRKPSQGIVLLDRHEPSHFISTTQNSHMPGLHSTLLGRHTHGLPCPLKELAFVVPTWVMAWSVCHLLLYAFGLAGDPLIQTGSNSPVAIAGQACVASNLLEHAPSLGQKLTRLVRAPSRSRGWGIFWASAFRAPALGDAGDAWGCFEGRRKETL